MLCGVHVNAIDHFSDVDRVCRVRNRTNNFFLKKDGSSSFEGSSSQMCVCAFNCLLMFSLSLSCWFNDVTSRFGDVRKWHIVEEVVAMRVWSSIKAPSIPFFVFFSSSYTLSYFESPRPRTQLVIVCLWGSLIKTKISLILISSSFSVDIL